MRCPLIIIATFSGIPARTAFLTAVWRKSWNNRNYEPKLLQHVSQLGFNERGHRRLVLLEGSDSIADVDNRKQNAENEK
jgi:hypothetical protein